MSAPAPSQDEIKRIIQVWRDGWREVLDLFTGPAAKTECRKTVRLIRAALRRYTSVDALVHAYIRKPPNIRQAAELSQYTPLRRLAASRPSGKRRLLCSVHTASKTVTASPGVARAGTQARDN
jgi:hypothetical protein